MKIKFIFLLILISQISFGQQYKTDTDGKIIYKVESGDGWYSIARKFNISYSELRLANKNISDRLSIGQTLKIPAKLKANDPFYQKNEIAVKPLPNKPSSPKFHKVEKGETLFSISEKFNLPVDELKALNDLKNNSISVGQKLIVGKDDNSLKKNLSEKNKSEMDAVKVAEPKEEIKKEENKKDEIKDPNLDANPKVTPAEDKAEMKKDHVEVEVSSSAPKIVKPVEPINPNEKKFVFSKGRKEVNETGVAAWIEDEEINPNKYYALHHSAPTGTIIKVTNKMNSRSVYVKVIGRLPETGDNEGILIKLSKASADKLGAIDQRFQVQLLYGLSEK